MCALVAALSEKRHAPFSMAIWNVELMHECFPKHWYMGTGEKKWDKETEKGKKRGISI